MKFFCSWVCEIYSTSRDGHWVDQYGFKPEVGYPEYEELDLVRFIIGDNSHEEVGG